MIDEIKFSLEDLNFTWDDEKNRNNLRKHGISFEEALYIFFDEELLEREDFFDGEERTQAFGRLPSALNVVMVVYAEREQSGIYRIISARRATRKEQNFYYENLSIA